MRFIKAFFCFLGFIFFLLLIGLAYLWFVDPFEIRPMLDALRGDAVEVVEIVGDETGAATGEFVDKHPALSETQEKALEVVGIDPGKLPTELTPEMELCFVEKLGAVRVAEIKEGASPTPTEVFTTRSCYE